MSSPLLPPERMALLLATEQIKRRENPSPNITAVLIMALARLVDKIGDEPLYKDAPARHEGLCWDRGGTDDACGCEEYELRRVVQVWSKEESHEGTD